MVRLKVLSNYIDEILTKFSFSTINIMQIIRNEIFIPLKINSLYTTEKPIYPLMGFFNDFSCSTLNN